jgi:uncharacterized membrane protein YdbT with pleckstrin-like domain
MPLVACPDCKGSVSTAAERCPHCGHPLGAAAAGAAPRVLAPGNVPGPERELWQGRPSVKAMLGTIAAAVVVSVGVPLAAFLLYRPLLLLVAGISREVATPLRHNADAIRLAAIAFVLVVVLGRLGQLAWRIAVLKSQRYRLTSQRLVIESGVLGKRIDEIDMRTVDDLEFRQTFGERLLGIGDITIIASDKDNPRTRLIGLERPRELRELIRTSAYQATHGQLFTRQT